MFYLPLLPNGKPVPLTWPMLFNRYLNVIAWPLVDNVTGWQRFISCLFYVGTFVIHIMHFESEFVYLYDNFNNLDELLTGIPTYFVLIEITLRAFPAGLKKGQYKKLLKKFYKEIYIEEPDYPDLFAKIRRQYWPILAFSILYLCALASYILATAYFLMNGRRETPYKMTLPFDINPLPVYVAVVSGSIWVGFIVAATILGESYTLAMFVFHVNGRYALMADNFHNKVNTILATDQHAKLAVGKFNHYLVQTLKENVRLNAFAREVQKEFSFRIFIIFSFIAASLCALGFKVYTSPMTSIPYIFWMIGKVQETIALGQVGTSIITATDGISSMYYNSRWECIIERSLDRQANVRLMKLIKLSVLVNRKPFQLTGLNFFSVSLTTSLTILQGAGSYFTCLTSLR